MFVNIIICDWVNIMSTFRRPSSNVLSVTNLENED